MPVHRRLKEILDATPRTSETIVTGARGRPLTVEGFKTVFFRLRDRLQAEGRIRPGLTFHGVRHTAALPQVRRGTLHTRGSDDRAAVLVDILL